MEIGATPFHFSKILVEAGVDLTAIDPSPERVNEEYFEGMQVFTADVETQPLPFSNGEFDTVLLMDVIEHFYVNPLFALREIARVMKPGGKLLVTTDNLYSLRYMKRFLSGRSINNAVEEWQKLEKIGHRGHIRLYSKRELRMFFAASGISAKEGGYYHHDMETISKAIYSCCPKSFLPHQWLVGEKPTKSAL